MLASVSQAVSRRPSGLAVVFRKEFVDSIRERRSMVSALVFGPLLGPVLFVLLTSYAVNLQIDEAEQPIDVPVIGGDLAENLMSHLFRRQIDVDHERFADVDSLRDAVRTGNVDVGLVVDPGFTEALQTGEPARLWIVTDTANNTARRSVSRLSSALGDYGKVIGLHRLALRGIDPNLAIPVAVLTDDVSTPSGRAVMLLGMMTYFLLFSTLLGGTQVAIDTTAGERERGSLEPLLALAVSRSELVWGKIGVTFVFMAVSLAICIVSFAIAVQFLPLPKIGMTANLTPLVCGGIYVSMLPFAALGAGVMTIVASYTKSFREAQTYTSIAMVAPPLPIILVILNPVQPSIPLMLVPSLSQHLLVTELVKGEVFDPLHVAVSAVTTVAVGVACALATVRRYRSEALLV
ncbi:MAG: ABC transporter permease [Gammaproteobacteria bacterium]|nr:ABC transporter permease [Gammaproteobacteria bacterium]